MFVSGQRMSYTFWGFICDYFMFSYRYVTRLVFLRYHWHLYITRAAKMI